MYESYNDIEMTTKDVEEINVEIEQLKVTQEEILDIFKNIKGFMTGEILPEMKKLAFMSKDSSTGSAQADETSIKSSQEEDEDTNWLM